MQELGPCPFLIVSREEETLDLSLECCPGWPRIFHHALIKANLHEAACTRAFQAQENSHRLLLIRGVGMGGSDPDFDLGPPLVKLLRGAVI